MTLQSRRAAPASPNRLRIRWTALFAAIVIAAPAHGTPEQDLRGEIAKVLAHPWLAKATVGVHVASAEDGRVLFSRGADRPLVPGSNMKLLTTSAALRHLGSGYRFRTEIRAVGRIEDGVVHGDLLVIGAGDPNLSGRFHDGDTTAPLADLARQVRAHAIRRVEGDLVLDASFFDSEHRHPNWPSDQYQNWYCAPISGLALNDNCVDFEFRPATPGHLAVLRFHPDTGYVSVDNRVRTLAGKGDPVVHIGWDREPGRFRARGTMHRRSDAFTPSIPVFAPERFFGGVLHDVLKREGVAIAGGVRVLGDPDSAIASETEIAEWPEDPPGGEAPSKAARPGPPGVLVALLENSLRDAIVLTNERSQNFCAEQVLKTLGREVRGTGSFDAGTAVVREHLEELGLWTEGCRIDDGSGLSRENRFTARGFVELLRRMAASEDAQIARIFFLSLPVSGMRGSLEDRLDEEPVRGRVAAKTGYVRQASALSGFAQCISGKTVVFSILMNDFGRQSNRRMKALQDRIARILVEHGG
jgi:D-alanyl-D-alanine carboxypeptidase/D-alanyl-D-alanine-endopeptidase (penicillin-binding protein 4)